MYKVMTVDELIDYCKAFKWTRKPKELHIHHTWKPEKKDFKGDNHLKMQESMANYHKGKGWSDIGQHLTLFPDGKFATGRDFNQNPASIQGRNALGFAIEMVGNFDQGHDKLEGAQLESIIQFSAFFMEFFGLDPDENIKFHREYASKTCPGNGIDKAEFIERVKGEEMERIKVVLGNRVIDGFLKDGKTYAEVRTLAENLGAKVIWNAVEKRVMVTK